MIIDFETFSELDLRRVGAYRYAEDPSTRILCMAYGDESAVDVWTPAEPFPLAVREAAMRAVLDGEPLVAHNAMFERLIWNRVLRRLVPGLPELGPEHWRCTLSIAARYGYPLALEAAGEAAGLDVRKDTEGARIMRLLSRPQKRAQPASAYERLYEYAAQDVRAELALAKALPADLDAKEREVWLLDQRINDRGVGLDVKSALAIREVVLAERADAAARLRALTGGAVETPTQAARLRAWCAERGVELPDMRAATVEAVLQGSPPDDVREALAIRADAAGAAVRKLDAMLACVCSDGRMRGLLQYYGATATGRWAGRLVQPQNLPRPSMDVDPEDFQRLPREALREKYGSVLEAAASALRRLIVAAPGRMLRRADLSAIEARLLFWLAGHEDAMRIYREGGDIYCEMASAVFGRPITKADKHERFIGKTIILGCGYQMGAPKFQATANAAGANITLEQAQAYVQAYRRRWHLVPALWHELESAARRAVLNPGKVQYPVAGVAIKASETALKVRIPSGRVLYWLAPSVAFEDDERPIVLVAKHASSGAATNRQVFGGLITERIVQALARDVLVEAMFRCEREELPVVLSVHDEIVTEPKTDGPGLDVLARCMAEVPIWAKGLVLASEAEEGLRYGK